MMHYALREMMPPRLMFCLFILRHCRLLRLVTVSAMSQHYGV